MKQRISKTQYFFLIPCLVYGKAIGVTSGILARRIGADTWTAMLIGFIIGAIIVAVTAYLGSKFPEKTIIQYSEELLGKWLGKAIGAVLAVFFLFAFAVSAGTMICHLKDYFLPETPVWIICIMYGAICMYGVRLGFEVIVRIGYRILDARFAECFYGYRHCPGF